VNQPNYNTALYMRLSRDDEGYGDSISIETQRTILRKFAQDNQLRIYDEYIDDGWSGTNFERPNFKRMMADIESGKVNCVVTKDLSRFGREHIMMDYYLEFVFPEKRVRYIAVAENEDTEKGLSDFVPFKNLFNEWFAKDTSRKVKNSLAAKFEAGERVSAYAPLGYKKHPDVKNKLVIDEETSWIIRRIYTLAFYGAGAAKITRTLTQEKIPTPGWLNYQRDGTFANIYRDAPEEKRYAWTIAQVKSILKDETYIGNTIHYRETNISYKNKKRIRKPQSEWMRVEGTQEAIISKEDFERVQQQIASRRRKQKNATTQIFAGLVRCADCGWSMKFATNKQNKIPYSYFSCTCYSQYGTGRCSKHYIRYDTLYAYVLARLQHWTEQVQLNRGQLICELQKSLVGERAVETRRMQNELARVQKRCEEVNRLFARLYEDWASGRLTEYNFTMLSSKYQAEQQELRQKILDAKTKLDAQRELDNSAEKWVDLIRKYAGPTELTAELLNALIEKILVHEAVKLPDGSRQQKVEIFYRFIGNLDANSIQTSTVSQTVSLTT